MIPVSKYKRDRDFQSAVLAKLEKPTTTPNKWLTFFNSRIFWGLFSLLFVTAGGSLYAKQRQCVLDAQQFRQRFIHINRELRVRQVRVLEGLDGLSTFGQTERYFAVVKGQYADLADLTLRELRYEHDQISTEIDFAPMREIYETASKNVAPIPVTEFNTYAGIFLGERSDKPINSGDFAKALSMTKNYFLAADVQSAAALDLTHYQPNCGIKTILYSLFSKQFSLSTEPSEISDVLKLSNILAPGQISLAPPIPALPEPFYKRIFKAP
jgi:hypothetical protein